MSYIGRGLQSGAFRQLDSIASSFDGSTTGFTMQVNSTNVIMGDANQILLSLGGVIQNPGTDFTISSSTLTFTTAPATGTSFFAILLGSDNGGTTTPTDGSVTGDKVASTGAFTIGAAGTASSLAGIPFYNGDTTSIYTHDVSGTDSTATHNTAYGITAMDAITTGDANTAIGWSAGSALNTGTQNTIVGKGALASASSAGSNTAIGWNAAYAVTTGTTAVTAIGDGAYNSAGDTEAHNIAIGVNAMAAGSLAGAEYNIAIGNYALDALTSGDENVIIGDKAGTDNTTGNSNTFVGSQAGTDNTTGYHNTIIGRHAGLKSTTGNENTFVGVYAGYESIGASHQNSFFGDQAGYNVTSGDNNVCIGYQAGTSASPTQLTTGSNRIIMGNNSTTNCDIKVDWTVTSDKRDKTDVEAFNMGLDFVNKLNPVTYRWDMRSDYENGTPDGTHKKPKLFSGLIAQDVEILEREYGYKVEDDTAVITSVNENGNYGLTYSKFVPILINAVKELSAEIKALKEGN